MTTTQTTHNTTELAIVLVVQIPNVPGRDVTGYADTIARMATAQHDATVVAYAVHSDPEVGWAAISSCDHCDTAGPTFTTNVVMCGEMNLCRPCALNATANGGSVTFRIDATIDDYRCPVCSSDKIATEDDDTASCDDCGAQGVCVD